MRNGRVIMATAVRQFEYENKKYLRQGALLRRGFLGDGFLGDNAFVTGIAEITPPLQGRGRGWGLSALRKPIDPTPTPPLKGRGLISQYATQQGKGEYHATPISGMTHLSP
jgi:hypothetical protein